MKHYILSNDEGAMTFTYGPDGLFLSAEVSDSCEWTVEQRMYALFLAGKHQQEAFYQTAKTVPSSRPERRTAFDVFTTDLEPDFEVLWKKYPCTNTLEKGDKKDAQKAWKKMDRTAQWLAIAHLVTYGKYLANKPGLSPKHVVTYLNKRQWENRE